MGTPIEELDIWTFSFVENGRHTHISEETMH